MKKYKDPYEYKDWTQSQITKYNKFGYPINL